MFYNRVTSYYEDGLIVGTSPNDGTPPNQTVSTDPGCISVNEMINDSTNMIKRDGYKRKLTIKAESGHTRQEDGTYIPGVPNPNNINQLNIYLGQNTLGFEHTHVNDYPWGGTGTMIKPIKALSPGDLMQFTRILISRNAQNLNLQAAYGTVISRHGVFTVKFKGNATSIPDVSSMQGVDNKKLYIEDVEDYGVTKGFLMFMKRFSQINNLDQLEFYKTDNEGATNKISLDPNNNNKLIEESC